MATASDSFSGGNGSAGPNWANVLNSLLVDSGGLEGDNATEREQCIRWTGNTFGTDQYSEAALTGVTTGLYYYGVAVRCSNSASTYYLFYGNATDSYLGRMVAGAVTILGSTGAAFPTNPTIRLAASGAGATVTLTMTVDGSAWTSISGSGIFADTDAARLTTGQVGCSGFARNDGPTRIDSWNGGDIGGGATIDPGIIAGSCTVLGNPFLILS